MFNGFGGIFGFVLPLGRGSCLLNFSVILYT